MAAISTLLNGGKTWIKGSKKVINFSVREKEVLKCVKAYTSD